jgi:tRNA-splicing ligase RtcB (3'-phosphate/5'-hydroxy nucleic acid ligase)
MTIHLRQVNDYLWEIPREGRMKVPGRIYLGAQQMATVRHDKSLEQVVNVAHLPGIVGYSLAMPDIHWGYGFPIGGVAAVDAEDGAVSPGGVGYDINCGCRVIATELEADEVMPHVARIVARLFSAIPTGVGSSQAIPRLDRRELGDVLTRGAEWAVERGFAAGSDDLAHCEEGGRLRGADPDAVPARAFERGADQLGTLGSGNHFVEVERVDTIYDEPAARAFGLRPGMVTLMIHSGSRGLGHETCDQTLHQLSRRFATYGPDYAALPDRQLACAPIDSELGRRYLGAMQAAANFAWANRQVMTGLALGALAAAMGRAVAELGARLVYDVCHNIAKFEQHWVGGEERRVLVHRKGATRAFGPGDERVPVDYRDVGQPVVIPGDMGRHSFVLAGNAAAMRTTFGSSCHGAGRLLSRTAAMKQAQGRRIDQELRARGIEVMSKGYRTLAEEMSEAYKDVADVVDVIQGAGVSRKVARLVPMGVIKG